MDSNTSIDCGIPFRPVRLLPEFDTFHRDQSFRNSGVHFAGIYLHHIYLFTHRVGLRSYVFLSDLSYLTEDEWESN